MSDDESVEKRDAEYELAVKARQNNQEAMEKLVDRFMPAFKKMYKDVSVLRDDYHYDDAIQAAMVGLYKAVHYYREDKNMAFHNFVTLCSLREMKSWQKKELNSYYIESQPLLSLDYALKEDEDAYLVDMVSRNDMDDPAEITRNRLTLESIFRQYDPQNTVEGKVLLLKMKGFSYKEISEKLGLRVKDVDNILLKIRKNIS
ncbi:MAG: sigma-70 family RNA polymerase sigma factor [Erysipelotrichaceae bacterium]|nr:sigma-70 family RNA polymerase sigma factor [Erysipelotrichaceae bacterium]